MTLNEFITLATKIRKTHPEAGDAEIWAECDGFGCDRRAIHIKYVGYDRRHKPARIKLFEEA